MLCTHTRTLFKLLLGIPGYGSYMHSGLPLELLTGKSLTHKPCHAPAISNCSVFCLSILHSAETAKTSAESTKTEDSADPPVQSELEKHSQNGVNATPRITEDEVKPIQIAPNKGIGEEQEKLADNRQQRPTNDSKDQSGEGSSRR